MKAAIDIVTQNNLAPDDIAQIKLHVGDYHDLMCQPMAERCAPATLADAKFSLPFLVAVATLRRGMSVTDFTQNGLRDPQVLAIARKITLVRDPALDWKLDLPLGRVEIATTSGNHWLREGKAVPGNADNPLTWDQIHAKFAECAAVSAQPLAADKVALAQDMAQHLETLGDATDLIRCLA